MRGVLLGAALMLVVTWWEVRRRRNVAIKRYVMATRGRDVDVNDAPHMTRDGRAVGGDGRSYVIGDRVAHDEWIEGSEPCVCSEHDRHGDCSGKCACRV